MTNSMLFQLNVGCKDATVSWLQMLFTITSNNKPLVTAFPVKYLVGLLTVSSAF